MSRTIDAVQAQKTTIATLQVMLMVSVCITVLMWWGWKSVPLEQRFFIPPDLRAGAIVKPGEYHAATIYGFASLYFKDLNRWPRNGLADYPDKIHLLQSYFTPKFYRELVASMNVKASDGELDGRERYVLEMEGYETYLPEHVQSLADGSWVVTIQLEIVERMGSLEVKRRTVEYPLHIVRMNVSPNENIFGLAINGIAPGRQERRL